MHKSKKVIEEFGNEWLKYNYANADLKKLFESYQQYFGIFPWASVSKEAIGFDMGCGSGRWAQFVAPKVKILNCIEPSKAIDVARQNLKKFTNVRYFRETTETCSLDAASQDFGYCLGVLHHISDSEAALGDCSRLLKKGAPFLLYLYYNFENKPRWFFGIWRVSDIVRRLVSKLPPTAKKGVCDLIAVIFYFPLSRLSFGLERLGFNVSNVPLSDYKNKPFYHCRNDALDRFGTRVEQRFSKVQIAEMLENTGFEKITFSDQTPYWCCVAFKK